MNERPIRAVLVICDPRVGGAERHVTTLLPRMDPARSTPSVGLHRRAAGLFGAGRRRVGAEFTLDRCVAAAEQAIDDVVCGRSALSESVEG